MNRLSELARARGVTRLVHFTSGRNVPHIIDRGALEPVEQLRESRVHHTVTDHERYDGYLDRTCCSIEYPNLYYLRVARNRSTAKAYPDWVALLLSVDLLDRPGVLLSPRNAAAGTAQPASERIFRSLYAVSVVGQQRFQRGEHHLRSVPTDLQAEVLIPDRIALSDIGGLLLPDPQSLRDLRANLRQIGRTPPAHWQWRTSPAAFDADRLRRCVHGGERPQEHDLV